MVKYKLFFLAAILYGCFSYESLVKTPMTSRSLKTNGYYIGNSNGVFHIQVLYNDGVIRSLGSLKSDKDSAVHRYINEAYIYPQPNKSSNKSPVGWGVFRISNQNIEYDMWQPRADAPVYRRKGTVLNDSTFIIDSYSKLDGKDSNKLNITYHFRQFNPKPDSTNKFIE